MCRTTSVLFCRNSNTAFDSEDNDEALVTHAMVLLAFLFISLLSALISFLFH